MITETLQVFKNLQEQNPELILSNYTLDKGYYILVAPNGNIEYMLNTENEQPGDDNYLDQIKFYDYHSKLVEMNKPVDKKKKIHSNNYLAFSVKTATLKGGELTEEIIDGYYNILSQPAEKYKKSKEATAIYNEFVKEHGEVNTAKVDSCRDWIKKNIFTLNIPDVKKIDPKEYVKVFFVADESEYEREEERYLLPSIYNSNKYNVEIEGEIYGVPVDINMNENKPYQRNNTRKNSAPSLITLKDALLRKQLLDYLDTLARSGKFNVYVDTTANKIIGCGNDEAPDKVISGYFLRIKRDKKGLIITAQEQVVGYENKLDKPFTMDLEKSTFEEPYKFHMEYKDFYKTYHTRTEIAELISVVFFNKLLSSNYFTAPEDIPAGQIRNNICTYRDSIFNWSYVGNGNLETILRRFGMEIVKQTLLQREKARLQLDVYYSLLTYLTGEDELDRILKNK